MKPKWLNSIFALVVLSGVTHLAKAAVDPTSLESYSTIPPQSRVVFTRFSVQDGVSEKDFDLLRNTPGINVALLELAERVAETENWTQLHHVWGLLSERPDFNESEIAVVRERLSNILDVYTGPGGGTIKQFGLTLLGRYPSSPNEDLLIKYLYDTNGGDKTPNWTDIAAESLGKIGTEKSMEALQAYIEKCRPLPGNKSRYYDTAVQALKEVQQRARSSASNAPSQQVDEVIPPATQQIKNQVQVAPMTSERHESTWWIALVVIAVTLTFAVWLLLSKRT